MRNYTPKVSVSQNGIVSVNQKCYNYSHAGFVDDVVDFFCCPVGVSPAPDGRRNNLEAAVGTPAGTGVLDPEGVRVLEAVRKIGALEVDRFLVLVVVVLADGLPGETNPVGVLGRDKDVPFVFNLRAEDDAVLPDRPDIADVLRGMRDGVSSVLSRDKLEP